MSSLLNNKKDTIMRKGKFIDIYILMACASHKKTVDCLQNIDELINKACTNMSIKKEAPATKPVVKNLAVA